MSERNEILEALDQYLVLQTTAWDKPSWFDCLAYLKGYFGELNLEMVMEVRKLQREGKVE